MNTTILVDRVNFQKEIDEVRWQWAEDLLIYIGIDEAILKNTDMPSIVEYLIENNIEIIDYPSIGALSISYNGDVVGEWAGPDMELHEDGDGVLYFKVDVENWSIIEEEIDE